MQLGLNTFGDVHPGPDGQPLSDAQVIRDVLAEGIQADRVGLDFFGVGEHHRSDFAISAPDTVLAGLATATETIRLGTAVSVLSSDDPVRLYQRFATVDALSSGRAEVVLGRGSFTESFPLFGYDLQDYEALFEEKLALFAALRTSQPVTWKGTLTQDLQDVSLYPPLENGPLPTWIAVGGSPQSVVRAAHYDLPLMLAIIGGPVERFSPFSDLYRRALAEFGHSDNPVAYHSYGYVADTDEQAREQFFRPYTISTERIGAERGWPAPTEESFLEEVEHGSMAVGSPETVARKIAAGVRALGASRFDLKISTGPLSHGKLMRSIELYGTRVAPLVRDMLAD